MIHLFRDAWLLTNGYDSGIVHLVGQALKNARLIHLDRKIIAIGICHWNSIRNKEFLFSSQNDKTDQVEMIQLIKQIFSLKYEYRVQLTWHLPVEKKIFVLTNGIWKKIILIISCSMMECFIIMNNIVIE